MVLFSALTDMFPADQHFIVFEFEDSGCDLEGFKVGPTTDPVQSLDMVNQFLFLIHHIEHTP